MSEEAAVAVEAPTTSAVEAVPETADFRTMMDAAFEDGEAAVRGAEQEPPAVGEQAAPETPETPEADTGAPTPTAIEWQEGERWRASADLPEDLTVSFREDGEDRTLSVDKLVKQAQRSQLNARQKEQYRQELKELRPLRTEAEQLRANAENADTLLQEILRGDNALLQKMRESYAKALGPDGKLPEPAPTAVPDDVAAGQKAIETIMLPHAKALGEAFGVETDDIAQELADLIGEAGQDPDFGWDALDAIMNEKIVELLEDLEYELAEGQELPQFDSSQYREAGEERKAADRPAGLQRRGSRKAPASTSAEQARIKELEAELQELRTAEAPDVGQKGAATGRGRSKAQRDKGLQSDLLDLNEATSYQDVLNAMDKQLR